MAGAIVVGVDGSEESLRALRWALDEARLRGAPLECVHAWSLPVVTSGGLLPITEGLVETLGEEAAKRVDVLFAGLDTEGVEVEKNVVEGPPAAVLVDAARDAELLVVGSRGHGGFAGLLLGSVSHQCAHHAACPVVIVPPPR
jgi:nucleotide-binding universal stress UspA family protein